MKDSTPVLVVIHSDGYVELYGPRSIDARIAILPDMNSAKGEILAEEYLDLNLPERHRRLHAPGMIRTAKLGRKITAHEIANTVGDLALMRAVDRLKACQHEEVQTWTL